MAEDTKLSDQDFVARLRTTIENYLRAVDGWESAYGKFYRMPRTATVSNDMEAEQVEYEQRRRELQPLLPRARRLCLKYQLRDPFTGLQRVPLGRYAPHERSDSAIGRSERNIITECLAQLADACRDWPQGGEGSQPSRPSLLRRLVSYFY